MSKFIEPKWVIDPKKVAARSEIRIRQWALSIMQKHEHRLNVHKFRDKEVVWTGVVEPEDIDIMNIYGFPELNWIIYRDGQCWSLMLRSHSMILANFTYATVEHI